ncbi:MAG: NAD(P)-dependent oxidoreductase [Verrucomicrobiota bacterium]|nr:NAD(P)-dependent oxidoreductase [Verrucomicrobiota bacterium]
MASRLLITGGSGFIGSHLLPFIPEDFETVLLTSRTAGAFRQLPSGHTLVVHGDISRQGAWQNEIGPCDSVIHMAVYHHARELDAAEMAYIDAVNISGMNHLIKALSASPPKRFIYLSSVKVSEWEKLDDIDKSSFSWTYARSKAQAEKSLEKWAKDNGVELIILRAAPVYGRGNVANLGELFAQVAQKKFKFIGSGEQRKSLCSVENLVAILIYLLQVPGEGVAVRKLTLSDGAAYPVSQIVRWIAAAARVRPPMRILNNDFWWAMLGFGEKYFYNQKTSRYFRLIRSWLTETVHDPDELTAMGLQMPYTTEEGIKRVFDKTI